MNQHTPPPAPTPTPPPPPPPDIVEQELDEALDESFPSSDPVAINITKVVPPPQTP